MEESPSIDRSVSFLRVGENAERKAERFESVRNVSSKVAAVTTPLLSVICWRVSVEER